MGAESPEPFFSILTTAYRTEQYLPEAIESVLSQTRGDWELIVVDNGYSDDIARIVGTYADDHRIGLIRQANRGYGGGVTAAAGTARGRVLTVLDSDDLLRPDFCERVGAVFEAEPHVAAVGCDATLFGFGDGTERGYLRSIGYRNRKRHVDVPLTFSDVLGGIVPYYSGAVRRDVWNAVGGYTAPAGVEEDVLLWLRITAAGWDVRLLDDRLARCRVRADSSSRDPSRVEAFDERLQATFLSLAGGPVQRRAVDPTLRRLRYHQFLRRARWALLEGDVRSARRAARTAFGQKPSLRAATVVSALAVAPGVLRRVHPLKQHLSGTVRRYGVAGARIVRPVRGSG
ncbi:glycosyltransferase family 2 protein [Rhodococcus indonesiensis]|uniref:glycosyltransferase family 2 protein n=1 Tax=Rhodococcus indonesiensis TaxID=3055869 RepID=UPI0039F6A620